MQRKEIQRGDLFYYDFGKREGSVQSGERPVMVIQADNFNANAPTIIVAAVTAVMKKKYLPSHIILGEDFGLKKPSMVLLEQIQTVNKDELTDYIGSVNDERLWKQINAALKKTFGLWIYNTDRNGDVRCLCPKCLSDYIHDPNYVVRRLDPFAKSKDHCDKCNNSGWDTSFMTNAPRSKERGAGMSNSSEKKKRYNIPLWCKPNLSIEEAAAYSGIGMGKLYEMTESQDCPFVLWIGSRRMIKRKVFDEFIERQYSI